MSKLQVALDIIRTIVVTFILFIIVGMLLFMYIERDLIGNIIINVTDNIQSVGQAAVSINLVSSKVNVWIDKGDVLNVMSTVMNDAKLLLERNKEFNITEVTEKLNIIVVTLQNISEILLLDPLGL